MSTTDDNSFMAKDKSRGARMLKSLGARARRKVTKAIKGQTELSKFARLRALRKKRKKIKKN
jgi:hypothetical protein